MPHERSLVERYRKRPFVLLGVNVDASRESLRKTQKERQITWRSWWDGPGGPITFRWGVSLLPTMYLLDHRGVVRLEFQDAGKTRELDAKIEDLVREAEAERAAGS